MPSTNPKIVSLEEIQNVTSQNGFHEKLVKGIADGFVQYESSSFFAPPIQTLGAPPMAPFVADCGDAYAGQTCVKSGYFKNNPYYVIKVAVGGHPLPNSGLMQIYSQQTGRLLALLLDEGVLTELRTAAVGALAFQLWSRCSGCRVTKIGILGTGVQARYQLDAIQHETTCRHLVVYGRTPAKVQDFQNDRQSHGWTVDSVSNPNDLLQECDIVITTTSARSPVLTTDNPGRCRLLICIGSDAPGKKEVVDSLLEKATLCVADTAEQSRQRGEFQGWSTDRTITNLGDWIRRFQQEENDSSVDGLVVFDSSGVALQDCVIAQMVYESL